MESVGASPDELGVPQDHPVGGSAESFEELFRAEQRRLHQALFAITGSRQEAEDIGQEAFLRLWERWYRVSALDDPVGYLHRTAINLYRDRSRRVLLAIKRAVRMAPQPNEYADVEARSLAASVLGQLPPRQRAAIVLTEGLGYSAEEAGQLLGIKGSTVRALHFQARSALSLGPRRPSMADLRSLVRDEMERAGSPSYSFDDLYRRRDRKRRNRRIAAGVVGIAVFVAAVWIVTNFGSLDRSQTSVVPGPAETGPAETAPPPAPVTPRWVFGQRALPCSDGARSILKLWVDARIRVRFEVHRSPVGHEWRIELAHPSLTDDDRNVFFRGTRVASDGGKLVVHERVSDSTIEQRPAGATVQGRVYPDPGYWAEPGVFLAKAVDAQTGQICRVYMGP